MGQVTITFYVITFKKVFFFFYSISFFFEFSFSPFYFVFHAVMNE